jgi:hypothetical protein
MADSEILELWDALRGFNLEKVLHELAHSEIPFIDFEPQVPIPRSSRKVRSGSRLSPTKLLGKPTTT